ncbi:MAG TPA: TetR/AcrR family transcriptional regulator [Solirubrobacterales bacterium]|nr:TetR/AcrR family transcriptional regulator [Solirubrobacterales bacterium]
MKSAKSRDTYHHGDLPAALIAATFELIEENGIHGFSVAEAARRTGVSISAPYRHFADRDELLAACATAACEELRDRFESALADQETPAERLAAASAAYVRFAAERRPMFEALFGAGLDKSRYPGLEEAAGAVLAAVAGPAVELAPSGDEEAAGVLVQALTSLAQGHATLLLEGGFGELPQAVELASERAAAAARALIRGRSLLVG